MTCGNETVSVRKKRTWQTTCWVEKNERMETVVETCQIDRLSPVRSLVTSSSLFFFSPLLPLSKNPSLPSIDLSFVRVWERFTWCLSLISLSLRHRSKNETLYLYLSRSGLREVHLMYLSYLSLSNNQILPPICISLVRVWERFQLEPWSEEELWTYSLIGIYMVIFTYSWWWKKIAYLLQSIVSL